MGRQRKLEILVGISPQTVGVFAEGQASGSISLGRSAAWELEAPGVQDFHAYLYFDGADLFVAGLYPEQPVWVDSVPLLAGWARLALGSELKIGQARLRYDEAGENENILPAPSSVTYGPPPPPFSVVAEWPVRAAPTHKGGTLLFSSRPAAADQPPASRGGTPSAGALKRDADTVAVGAARTELSGAHGAGGAAVPVGAAEPFAATKLSLGGHAASRQAPSAARPTAVESRDAEPRDDRRAEPVAEAAARTSPSAGARPESEPRDALGLTAQPIPLTRERRAGLRLSGQDETPDPVDLGETCADTSQSYLVVPPELLLAHERRQQESVRPGSGRARVEGAWARLPFALKALAFLVPIGLTVWSLYLFYQSRG